MIRGAAFSELQRKLWNDRFSGNFGPPAVGTPGLGEPLNVWRYRVRRRVFRRVAARLFPDPRGLSVLDVGCGTGFYLHEWQRLGAASLAGVDISDHAIAGLERAFPQAAFYRADISDSAFSLPPRTYDVAGCIDVLTHILHDDAYLQALRNIGRSLKPGGYLLYTDTFFHGPDKVFGDYWRGRSLRVVEESMPQCGFELISRVPFSVLFSPPTDTRHRERNERLWELAMLPVVKFPPAGYVYGPLIYPLELLLVFMLKESPAIELMICRRREEAA